MDLHMPVLDGFQVRILSPYTIQTIGRLREIEQKGQVCLATTQVIAVSAITAQQFRNSLNQDLFDMFRMSLKLIMI